MIRGTLLSLSFGVAASLLTLMPVTAGRAAAPVAAPLAATRTIDTGEYYFGPATVTVSVGDTVVWANSGREAHDITAANGSFGSGDLEPGQSYSFTFSAPGTYNYICSIHEGQNGVIVVQ